MFFNLGIERSRNANWSFGPPSFRQGMPCLYIITITNRRFAVDKACLVSTVYKLCAIVQEFITHNS